MSLGALLLVDRERLRDEYAQLGRLAVALTINGCSLRVATPGPPFGDDHPADGPIGLDEPIRYPDRVAPWLRQSRSETLLEQLDRRSIDLLWCAGHRSWRLASSLSVMLERPMVIDVDGHAEAAALRRQRGLRSMVAGVITPSESLRDLVARSYTNCEVTSILPGIALGDRDRDLRRNPDSDGPLGLSVLGTGRNRTHDRVLLEALAGLRERGVSFQCVMELSGPVSRATWRTAQKLELTDVLTAIEEPSRMATLLAAGDVLVRASIEDRIRPVVLQAMAEGTPVVTMPERWLDHLDEDHGATVVQRPTSQCWLEALDRLLGDRAHREAQGEQARNTVSAHNRSSDRARLVHDLFERIVGHDPLPMHEA